MRTINQYGDTRLITAARKGEIKDVSQLLAYCTKEDFEQRNDTGHSAYLEAARTYNFRIMALLMAHKYFTQEHYESTDYLGRTALIFCSTHHTADGVRMLLKHKFFSPDFLNKTNVDGWSPLMYAAKHGSSSVVTKLISHPQFTQAFFNQTAICNEVTSYGESAAGFTPLMFALLLGRLKNVEAILTSPYCTTAFLRKKSDQTGETALIKTIKIINVVASLDAASTAFGMILSSPQASLSLLDDTDNFGNSVRNFLANHIYYVRTDNDEQTHSIPVNSFAQYQFRRACQSSALFSLIAALNSHPKTIFTTSVFTTNTPFSYFRDSLIRQLEQGITLQDACNQLAEFHRTNNLPDNVLALLTSLPIQIQHSSSSSMNRI